MGYLRPRESGDATPLDVDADGFVTLTANTTYFFPVDSVKALSDSLHAQWDSSIVITSIKLQASCMAEADVADHAAASAGNWLHIDPTDAYIPVVGGTATAATVAVAGGSAGGAIWTLPTNPIGRQRVAVAVGATGGEFRLGHAGSW